MCGAEFDNNEDLKTHQDAVHGQKMTDTSTTVPKEDDE
jgi:hypothetical protein